MYFERVFLVFSPVFPEPYLKNVAHRARTGMCRAARRATLSRFLDTYPREDSEMEVWNDQHFEQRLLCRRPCTRLLSGLARK